MKFVKWILVVCMVLVVAGCSSRSFESRLNVESYFNPDGNYGTYKTFAWVNYGTSQIIIKDPQTRERVVAAIENELKSRGLTYDAKSPDLMVGYHGAVEQKLDEEVVQTYYTKENYDMDDGAFKQIDSWDVGTLAIMIFDAKDGAMLWRASAQAELDERASASDKKKNIETAVRKMLETMPKAREQK